MVEVTRHNSPRARRVAVRSTCPNINAVRLEAALTAGNHPLHLTWNSYSSEYSSNSGRNSPARHASESHTGARRAASARGARPEGHVLRTDHIPGRLENSSHVPSTRPLRFCAAPSQAVQLAYAERFLTRQTCTDGINRCDLKYIFSLPATTE